MHTIPTTHRLDVRQSLMYFPAHQCSSRKRLESGYQDDGRIILLVSHGDTLQITLTAYAGIAPERHRSLEHLSNCDVRELTRQLTTAIAEQ